MELINDNFSRRLHHPEVISPIRHGSLLGIAHPSDRFGNQRPAASTSPSSYALGACAVRLDSSGHANCGRRWLLVISACPRIVHAVKDGGGGPTELGGRNNNRGARAKTLWAMMRALAPKNEKEFPKKKKSRKMKKKQKEIRKMNIARKDIVRSRRPLLCA